MQGPRHLSSRSRRLSLSGLLLIALLVPGSGCRSAHVITADAHGAPQYESLRLVYDVVEPALRYPAGATPLDLETAKARPLRAALVSRRSSPEIFKQRSVLRLAIDYPHPDGITDAALVTVAEPSGRSEWQAAAQQTLSRAELDLLFVHLVNGGVCDSERHQNGGTRIAVEVDGTALEKPWNREPRLDRLAVETYDACR